MLIDSVEHSDEHRRIRRDLWEGDGRDNPSVTARLSILEDTMDKITANIGKLVWLVVTTVAAVATDVIVHFIGK